MSKIRHLRIAALTGCLVVLAGCGPMTSGPGRAEREALQASRKRWDQSAVTSYRFTLQLHAMIIDGRPISIEVRGGTPVSVSYVDSGQAVGPNAEAGFVARFDTVEELFGIIEQAVVRNAHQISAAYDPLVGYPVSAYVDPRRTAIDDEFRFRVTGFEALR